MRPAVAGCSTEDISILLKGVDQSWCASDWQFVPVMLMIRHLRPADLPRTVVEVHAVVLACTQRGQLVCVGCVRWSWRELKLVSPSFVRSSCHLLEVSFD
jgi:hypothetical protein